MSIKNRIKLALTIYRTKPWMWAVDTGIVVAVIVICFICNQ